MAQVNVSLPEGLKSWADSRVAEGRYSSTSDYIRDLMRRDQEREEVREQKLAWLRDAWEEGLASGDPIEGNFDPDEIVARNAAKLEARRAAE